WLAVAASLITALLVLPMLGMREFSTDSAKDAGQFRDTVVHGRVVASSGHPIRNAVVTVMTPDGEQIDWSQVDAAGEFSAAVPGAGRYLLVTAAEGWTPQSRLTDIEVGQRLEPIVLVERLIL